jgi:hypothetical protein
MYPFNCMFHSKSVNRGTLENIEFCVAQASSWLWNKLEACVTFVLIYLRETIAGFGTS